MAATGKQIKVGNGKYDKDKTKMVGVRFSEEFLKDVKGAAESMMVTTSTFVRIVVNKEIKRMKEKGEI